MSFLFFVRKVIKTHENQRIWKKNQLKTALIERYIQKISKFGKKSNNILTIRVFHTIILKCCFNVIRISFPRQWRGKDMYSNLL